MIDSSDTNDPQQQQQPLPAGKELLLECVTPDLGQPRANIWLWFKNGQPIESSSSSLSLGPLGNRFPLANSNNNNPSSATIETEVALSDLISNRDGNPITGQPQELSGIASSSSSSSSAPIGANNNNNNNSNNKLTRRGNGPASELPQDAGDEATAREIHRPPLILDNQQQQQQQQANGGSNIRLINSGRYLYIASIQLGHKGNYSCVAVNRLGSSQKLQQPQQYQGRDSYLVSVALAPSFVQPLASRTYWPETPIATISNEQSLATTTTTTIAANNRQQLELVCHIQCEPICQVEWLRNNDPLDLKRQSESLSSNYVTYTVKQTIYDENLEANLFKSVESKLVIQFLDYQPGSGHSFSQRSTSSSSGQQQQSQQQYRDKILERRALLSGSNYTCQSSPNSMGPPVRSTTKFIVQCE